MILFLNKCFTLTASCKYFACNKLLVSTLCHIDPLCSRAILPSSRQYNKSGMIYNVRVIYLQSKVLQRRRNKKRRKSGICCGSSAFDRPSRSSRKKRYLSYLRLVCLVSLWNRTHLTQESRMNFFTSLSLSLFFFLLYVRLSGSTIISKSRRLTTTTEELISRGRGWPLRTRQPSGKSWTSLRVRRWPFMKTVDTSPGTLLLSSFVYSICNVSNEKITPCVRTIN